MVSGNLLVYLGLCFKVLSAVSLGQTLTRRHSDFPRMYTHADLTALKQLIGKDIATKRLAREEHF